MDVLLSEIQRVERTAAELRELLEMSDWRDVNDEFLSEMVSGALRRMTKAMDEVVWKDD